jgi:hypothetical protein
MKQLWICALCLAGILIAGQPLHAQSASSPQPTGVAAAASTADFLASLQTPPAPVEPPPMLWTSCTVFQCRSNCVCGSGCSSVCTSLTLCSCACRPNSPGGGACQV